MRVHREARRRESAEDVHGPVMSEYGRIAAIYVPRDLQRARRGRRMR